MSKWNRVGLNIGFVTVSAGYENIILTSLISEICACITYKKPNGIRNTTDTDLKQITKSCQDYL